MSKLKVITDLATLLASKESWNALAGGSPFCRWEWLASWVRHLGSDWELAILVQADATGKWIGIAPFGIHISRTGTRRLRFLGSGDACTDYATLICAADDVQKFTANVAEWLKDAFCGNDQCGGYDLIEFDGVAEDDVATNLLAADLQANRFTTYRDELEGCWVVDLPETWTELNSTFSKSLRRKSNAAARKLTEDQSSMLSSRELGLEAVWPKFVQLHQQRREMLGQPGCFASTSFEAFLKDATIQLAESDMAEVVVLVTDGSPIAAVLSFNDGDTKMLYQTGFDVDRCSESPGYLLIVQELQCSIERGFTQFDFLRGDEPYKSRWNTKRIALTRIRLVPPKLSATIRHNLRQSARSVKSALNSVAMSASCIALLSKSASWFQLVAGEPA